MRLRIKHAVLSAAAVVGLLAFGATAQAQTEKCEAAEIKCVGKLQAGLLGCYSKAQAKGLPVDPACIAKNIDKFSGVKGCFTKAAAGTCPVNGTAADYQAAAIAWINDVLSELDPAFPPGTEGTPTPDDYRKCLAAQTKCVLKKASGVLGCYSKAAGKNEAVDSECLTKQTDKFEGVKGCYTKSLTKPPCPSLVSLAAQLEAKTDAFAFNTATAVQDAAITCTPGPTCPNSGNGLEVCNAGQCDCAGLVEFTGDANNPKTLLDAGWTGFGHDSKTITDGTITVQVTSCDNAVKPCGQCSFTGPVDNVNEGAGQITNHRCLGDLTIQCNVDGDCGGAAPCRYFFGAPLPLTAGSVSTCTVNEVSGGITGTFNSTTGESESLVGLTARVYGQITIDQPCPICAGDPTPNDNVQGGTCAGGPENGSPCDRNGTSPVPAFGSTSFDCPPAPGNLIATLPVPLNSTTGTASRSLSSAPGQTPNCRATGQTSLECFCDTCANAAATPCGKDSDCSSGTCGGARCLPGAAANVGLPCTTIADCGGTIASCGRPGTATKPNDCNDTNMDGLSNDCTASGTEGFCASGPAESVCSIERFRGCATDMDCNGMFPGSGVCVSPPRECYPDNGVNGGTVTVQGVASTPVNDSSIPTLGTTFCIGPTISGAVNNAAGLPGLGRLTLAGQARGLP